MSKNRHMCLIQVRIDRINSICSIEHHLKYQRRRMLKTLKTWVTTQMLGILIEKVQLSTRTTIIKSRISDIITKRIMPPLYLSCLNPPTIHKWCKSLNLFTITQIPQLCTTQLIKSLCNMPCLLNCTVGDPKPRYFLTMIKCHPKISYLNSTTSQCRRCTTLGSSILILNTE